VMDLFLSKNKLTVKKAVIREIFREFLNLKRLPRIYKKYLLGEDIYSLSKLRHLNKQQIRTLFENLANIQFSPEISQLFGQTASERLSKLRRDRINSQTLVFRKIRSLIRPHYSRRGLKSLEDYLRSSQLPIEKVIHNWPEGIKYRPLHKIDEYKRLLASMDQWEISSEAKKYFSECSGKVSEANYADDRMRKRNLIIERIRNLFQQYFDRSFLESGLLKMLENYLRFYQIQMEKVIERWPKGIKYSCKKIYGVADHPRLLESMDHWKVSNEVMASILQFKESGPPQTRH
jgi:hypothetical protein